MLQPLRNLHSASEVLCNVTASFCCLIRNLHLLGTIVPYNLGTYSLYALLPSAHTSREEISNLARTCQIAQSLQPFRMQRKQDFLLQASPGSTRRLADPLGQVSHCCCDQHCACWQVLQLGTVQLYLGGHATSKSRRSAAHCGCKAVRKA